MNNENWKEVRVRRKNLLIVENPNEQLGFVIRRFGNCVGFSDYLEMETATVKK